MTDRFELIEKIGSGGMGAAWKARDTETNEVVALKLVHPHLAEDPDYIARFEREVEVARRIDSRYVVRVLGYGLREGVPYMAMEYVEGQSLRDLMQERGRLEWSDAKPIIRQVAEALDAAHAAGVIHRDVKPSNILITADGTAKLADFGIARALDLTRLIGSSTMLGTPHYMAPEGTASPQSDLYSLGCVLFELLAGHPPFDGESQQAVIAAHIRDEPQTAGLTSGVRPLAAWLLAKSPADRPASAGDFLQALNHGRPLTKTVPPARPRWPVVLAGVVLVTLLLGFAVGVVRFGPEESSAGVPSQPESLPEDTAFVSNPAVSGTASGVTPVTSPTSPGSPTPAPSTPSPAAIGSPIATQTLGATANRTAAAPRLTSIAFVERVPSDTNCTGLTGYRFSVPSLSALPALSDGTGRPTASGGVLVDGVSAIDSGYGWHRGADDFLTICAGQGPAPGDHTVTVYFGDDRVSSTFTHTREAAAAIPPTAAVLARSPIAQLSRADWYEQFESQIRCDLSRPLDPGALPIDGRYCLYYNFNISDSQSHSIHITWSINGRAANRTPGYTTASAGTCCIQGIFRLATEPAAVVTMQFFVDDLLAGERIFTLGR